jgi:hypothetical protein
MMASEALLLAGLIVLPMIGLITRQADIEDQIGLGFGALARGIAIVLFIRIADEYRRSQGDSKTGFRRQWPLQSLVREINSGLKPSPQLSSSTVCSPSKQIIGRPQQIQGTMRL